MKHIDEIMDLPMQALLCQQLMVDDLDVWKGMVIATVQECTECYYGHMLLQDITVKEFTLEEIKQWFCSELGYDADNLMMMLDIYYDEEPVPDPIHDADVDYSDIDADYDRIMMEELAWYNHARMMGWE